MFTANRLAIEMAKGSGPQIWLGDVSSTGETRQYLCLGFDEDPDAKGLYLELNGQMNACDGQGIQSIELQDNRLVVHLAKGAIIRAGTVSKPLKEQLSQIEVQLNLGLEDRTQLEETLRDVVGKSCPLTISESRKGGATQ